MPIYTGSSADGSDIRQVRGMYISPDGNEFSNMPYTKEQRIYDTCYTHIAKYQRSFRMEYDIIKQGKSILPKACRLWIVEQIENTE